MFPVVLHFLNSLGIFLLLLCPFPFRLNMKLYLDFSVLPAFVHLINELQTVSSIFDVLLTVHLSIFISYLTNLMHKICFTISFISCLYMFRAHVLIIRKSKLHYTACGIITPIGGRLVHETARAMRFMPVLISKL